MCAWNLNAFYPQSPEMEPWVYRGISWTAMISCLLALERHLLSVVVCCCYPFQFVKMQWSRFGRHKKKSFALASLNIRSLPGQWDALKLLVQELNSGTVKILPMGLMSFFARVGPELARTFDDVDAEAFEQYLPPPHHSAEIFTFCKVTEGIVLKFLGKMQSKCSQGPNGVSTKLLKVIIPHIETIDTLL